jgi:hypothetical protein
VTKEQNDDNSSATSLLNLSYTTTATPVGCSVAESKGKRNKAATTGANGQSIQTATIQAQRLKTDPSKRNSGWRRTSLQ